MAKLGEEMSKNESESVDWENYALTEANKLLRRLDRFRESLRAILFLGDPHPHRSDIDEEARIIIGAYGFYAVRLTIEAVYSGGRYGDTRPSEVSREFATF